MSGKGERTAFEVTCAGTLSPLLNPGIIWTGPEMCIMIGDWVWKVRSEQGIS